LNESDAYALEEALQLKEKHGGEVIVVSAGPQRIGTTIREALAKGADRAIQIACDDLGSRDALGVARLLAAAIKPETPDLILTGLQSEDLGLGQTGVIVAELLALPHASLILHVEMLEGAGTQARIKVKRELEEGWFQDVELPTPVVLTIQSGGNKLRYATLMGIKRAKTKEVRQLTAAELGVESSPVVLLDQVTMPQKKKSTQMLSGTASEAAAALVDKRVAFWLCRRQAVSAFPSRHWHLDAASRSSPACPWKLPPSAIETRRYLSKPPVRRSRHLMRCDTHFWRNTHPMVMYLPSNS
jgi:electron transfer flavoprotein beta subunit